MYVVGLTTGKFGVENKGIAVLGRKSYNDMKEQTMAQVTSLQLEKDTHFNQKLDRLTASS